MKKVCFYIISIILVVVISLQLAGELDVTSVITTFKTVPSEEEAVQTVYEAMKTGDTNISIYYAGSKSELESYAQQIVEEAFLIDDETTSDDFDYMKNKYRGYTAGISGLGVYTINYEFEYSETETQTEWVNEQVAQIISDFGFDEKSEYEKVKMIHDYIIDNISYDITVQYNSAYEALMSQATACQGYANLAYKLFTEAGIGCRIITGTADGEAHAWNIVEIDGLWYNIDCTWDDPIGASSDNNQYDYFLKSNNNFTDHVRDAEYDTDEFNEIYRMTDKNWKAD